MGSDSMSKGKVAMAATDGDGTNKQNNMGFPALQTSQPAMGNVFPTIVLITHGYYIGQKGKIKFGFGIYIYIYRIYDISGKQWGQDICLPALPPCNGPVLIYQH